jgi:hypothetical protein
LESLPKPLHLLIRCVEPLARLPCALIHGVQSGLDIAEDGAILLQLPLDEPGLCRQLLQPLIQRHPGSLTLLGRGLNPAANVSLDLSQPLLGEFSGALIGSIQRANIVPERGQIAPHREHVVVRRAAPNQEHRAKKHAESTSRPPCLRYSV